MEKAFALAPGVKLFCRWGQLIRRRSSCYLASATRLRCSALEYPWSNISQAWGKIFQDHLLLLGCVWEHQQPEAVAQREQAVLLWKSNSSLDTPGCRS